MQRQGQASSPTTCIGHCPQTILRQSAGVTVIAGLQHVRVPYNNVEDYEEEDNRSRNHGSKFDEADNAFGDFQNNDDGSDKNEIYHYCGPHGFN